MEILLIFAAVLPIIYIISFYVSRKKTYNSFDDTQKETLKSIKEKTKKERMIIIIVFCLIYVLLTAFEISTVVGVVDVEDSLERTVKTVNTVKSVSSTILAIPMYSVIMFTLETFAFKMYIKFTKKLDEKEREIALKYYKGKIIFGIISGILLLFACQEFISFFNMESPVL